MHFKWTILPNVCVIFHNVGGVAWSRVISMALKMQRRYFNELYSDVVCNIYRELPFQTANMLTCFSLNWEMLPRIRETLFHITCNFHLLSFSIKRKATSHNFLHYNTSSVDVTFFGWFQVRLPNKFWCFPQKFWKKNTSSSLNKSQKSL